MNEEKPAYWKAFLTHPRNKTVVMGVTALSVLASFPMGWDGMALGLLGLAAIEMIGLATVPGLPAVQQWVDKRERFAARERRRQSLLSELRVNGNSRHLKSYEQMITRVAALYRTAQDRTTSLTEREVEQLDDLTLDYLRMCTSDAVIGDGGTSDFINGIKRKITEVDSRLDRGGLDPDETAQLQRAKTEYEETLARRARIMARRSVLDASLVAMPMRMEEVFQMVMTSPRDGNLTQLLEESVSKLKLAEEAALDISASIDMPRGSAHSTDIREAAARRAVGQRS